MQALDKAKTHQSASFFSRVYLRTIVPSLVKFFHKTKLNPVQFVFFRVAFVPVYLYLFWLDLYIPSGLLFYCCRLLDHVDGALARAEGRQTPLAGYFDDLFDMVAMLFFTSLIYLKLESTIALVAIIVLSLTFIMPYLKLRYVNQTSIRPDTYYRLLNRKIDLTLFFGGEAHRFWLFVSLLLGVLPLYVTYLTVACLLETANLLALSMRQITLETMWKTRAKTFEDAGWVADNDFLLSFIEAGGFAESDKVLDVGCGTGIVSRAVQKLTNGVTGIDSSQAMIDKACTYKGDITYCRCDVRDLTRFPDGHFDKVTARMVFHHILHGREQALSEIYRVLKPNGKLVLGEIVPPNRECKPLLEQILRLKEQRVTYLSSELVDLLRNAGFKTTLRAGNLRNLATKKWLESSNLPPQTRQKMLAMYLGSPVFFKDAYNMRIIDGDAIVDCTFAIVVGEKTVHSV